MIRHDNATWYTTGTLEEVCRALNAGEPLEVWGYNMNGDVSRERMIFYGDPSWVSTDRGVQPD